jgi:cell division protein FtsI (penicillin-binding protein 3)
VTLLAAMDDGFVDENTKINIGGIEWTYAGQRITDSHSGGVYDISDIMAQSSNIGAAKVITSHYAIILRFCSITLKNGSCTKK